jgi:hypothetical protein
MVFLLLLLFVVFVHCEKEEDDDPYRNIVIGSHHECVMLGDSHGDLEEKFEALLKRFEKIEHWVLKEQEKRPEIVPGQGIIIDDEALLEKIEQQRQRHKE